MEFRILGPVEALEDGRALPIGGPRQRALLALLLLNANDVVSSERLIDELWSAEQPKDPHTALQNQVSRLRKALDGRISGRAHGYLIRVEPGELDREHFRSLVAGAEEAEPKERSQKLREALSLWHGRPLTNVAHEPFAELEAARLEEMRLAALEERINADLELGRHADLVGELQVLTGEHPLRERPRGQLMLALYRCGRQAEALDVFREGRRVLVDELGLEPSAELKDLEAAILRQDPALIVPERRRRGVSEAAPPRHAWRRRAAMTALVVPALLVPTIVLAMMDDDESPPRAPGADGAPARPTPAAAKTTPAATTTPAAPSRPAARSKPAAASSRHAATSKPAASPKPARRVARTTNRRHGRPRSTPQDEPERPARTRPPASPPAARPRPSTPSKKASSPSKLGKSGGERTAVRATTRPSNPPSPQTAPRGDPSKISDDFAGGGIDPQKWHLIVTGTEVAADERNGRFEVTIGANAVAGGAYNVIDGHLGTQCRFPGDFDAQVEYELVRWPFANGVNVGLAAFFANARVLRQSGPTGDFYESWITPRFNQAGTATGTNGALRLARVNGTITTYYQAGDGRWVKLDSAPAAGTAVIGPSAQSTNDRFGHTQVEVAFDNFVVEGDAINCPPG